jgi:MFS family permease
VQQRGAVLAIYGAIYTLAGMIAPSVMGIVIQNAAVPLDGYMTGFTINAVVMVASGLLGLLLLWPNTERARLMAQATVQAEICVTRWRAIGFIALAPPETPTSWRSI